MEEEKKPDESLSIKTQSSPCLIFFYEMKKQRYQTFFNLSKGCYIRNIEQMQNVMCFPTPQGWMLIVHPHDKYCYLFDPLTMSKKNLPSLHLEAGPITNLVCVLSSSPTEENCTVLCADMDKKLLFFCQDGDTKWTFYKYNLGDHNLSNVAACDGKFYGLTMQVNFATIDCSPNPRINILEPLNFHWPVGTSATISYLVESCGEMYSVERYKRAYKSNKTTHISVKKRDSSRQAWDTVYSIGGRVILLGWDDSSASWSASELGVKGDCIYYVETNDKRVYCFDLEEGCISVHMPCPRLQPSGLTPIWILPAS
ncbi:uncharacterized protein A4U43_UnF6510 [Asparagus officinalis]|uniref:KIB1-4 beta-propeller domain-containing protein n=2 Tax=Asparagus officinalis TaxID=4686 RepID=A0A1R3L6G6_ASPOF|nr:F-box/kelch-repeat protein At1g57790-like isoform X1 [Asparagus officinalis]XP_020250297.1 F-box/kelch-repeat protein At1g57790-like isoform X1 [Asparagus officinalis]ONK55198.1 uncharacterized protein A4U43_UnF6510 [Asparagus officinalis]